MLKQIQINNFQSHKHSQLDLAPGVNVIIGTSDAGKSAIFRALNWLLTNRPLGKAYVRWKAKECKVGINLNDTTIQRIKSSKNVYTIDDQEYIAGQDVPEQIAKTLQVSQTNIQHQISPPFLLASSPGEVAQFFNDIAGLSDIDKSMKNIQSNLRKLDRDVKTYQEQEQQLKGDLQQYEYLDQAEEEITALEANEERSTQLTKQIGRLGQLLQQVGKYQQDISELEQIAQAIDPIFSALEMYEQKSDLEQKHNRLSKLIYDAKKYEELIGKKDVTAKALDSVKETEDKKEKLQQVKRQEVKLSGLLGNINSAQTNLDGATEQAQELEAQLHEQMPNVCPLCNQEIKDETN